MTFFGDDVDSFRAARNLDTLDRYRARLRAASRPVRPYQLAGSVLMGVGSALEFTAAVRHVGTLVPICGAAALTAGLACTVFAVRKRAAYLKSHPLDV